MRSTPKILFIDDDKFFLEFYRSELAQYNVYTEFALDGEEGIEKAKELKPDVILLDVILPKKDGFEVLEEIKSDELTKDIPVVIISGLNSDNDLNRLLELGALKIFNKLTCLPRDVADYIQSLIEGEISVSKKESSKKETFLSGDNINKIFSDSLAQIEKSFKKMFNGEVEFKDFNVAFISGSTFRRQVEDISKDSGTIFVYGSIDDKESGTVIFSIKKNDVLSLVKLIEEGMSGNDLGLTFNDKVLEEFFNIIINAFLTKLSKSINRRLILDPPKINNASDMMKVINSSELKKDDDNLVISLKESYIIKNLSLSYTVFIVFGKKIFNK